MTTSSALYPAPDDALYEFHQLVGRLGLIATAAEVLSPKRALPVPPLPERGAVGEALAAGPGARAAGVSPGKGDATFRTLEFALNAWGTASTDLPDKPRQVLKGFVEKLGLQPEGAAMEEALQVIEATHRARFTW